jgi:glucosamine kinase
MSILAVDVGGTSTRAAVVTPDGTCIGYARAGRGNPTSSSVDDAAAAIVQATHNALTAAGAELGDVVAGIIGIAGAGAEAGASLRSALAAAGVHDRVAFEVDVLTTYCSGTLAPDGYVIVAGTGAAAVRILDRRTEATCDGLGWLLGDSGSGFWIGHRAVRAAVDALGDRGPATVLVDPVLQLLGVDPEPRHGRHGRPITVDRVMAAVYRLRPVELAEFAPIVFDAAARGDAVADAIVDGAATELSATLSTVVSTDVRGPLVLGGSILTNRPEMADRVGASFRDLTGLDEPVVPVADGIAGAAVIALLRSGVDVDTPTFERLHRTLASIR